ncbi:MAG: RibD family protein [Methanomassiliicoccales archaeon]
MKPKVIVQNSVSADGRVDWFKGDAGLYYSLAAELDVDATLTGADTILSSREIEVPETGSEQPKMEGAQPLFITDSRGRIGNLSAIRAQPYFSDIIVLCSKKTPKGYISSLKKMNVEYIVAGDDKVDLKKALDIIASKYGIKRLRIDSGGTLNGALMREGLVDEVMLLINPYAVGGMTSRSWYRAPDLGAIEGVVDMDLVRSRKLKGGVQLLHYSVKR